MRIFVFIFWIVSTSNYASEIFNCYQAGSNSITYDPYYKHMFITSAGIKSVTESKVTFVVNEKNALLKGNNGNGIKLTRFGESFIEDTGTNLILWKLLKNSVNKKETYLFSMKAYDSAGPSSYTTLYRCN